jgi:hypothetical protein
MNSDLYNHASARASWTHASSWARDLTVYDNGCSVSQIVQYQTYNVQT